MAALLQQYHADVNLQEEVYTPNQLYCVVHVHVVYVHIPDIYCSEPFYCGLCPCHYPQVGQTALWQASFRGHAQVADLLLKAKASVDTPNNDVSQVVFV